MKETAREEEPMITLNCINACVKDAPRGRFSVEITDGEGNVKLYEDLTSDLAALTRIVDLINAGDVSPIHIEDIIDDLLG